MKKKYIKIISGKFRNIHIKTINNKLLKPTLINIRKTLFNWLNKYIKNKICLDCFSGSGILGIECLSNNAKYVILLEKNYKIFNNIKKNINNIKKTNYKIININSLIWLKKKNNIIFDIIFLDPPYKMTNLLNKCIKIIENNNLIKKNSLIYIETSKKNNNIKIPKKWKIYKKKKNNNNKFYLFIKT